MENLQTSPSVNAILMVVRQMPIVEMEKLVDQLIAIRAERVAPHLTADESALLSRINKGLPAKDKDRMRAVIEKRDDETIIGVLAVGRRDRGPPFAYGAELVSFQVVALGDIDLMISIFLLLCPHAGLAIPACGRSLINRLPTFSRNLFVLSPSFAKCIGTAIGYQLVIWRVSRIIEEKIYANPTARPALRRANSTGRILMSDFREIPRAEITRRDFLHTTAALTAFCLLDCEATAQQANAPFSNALADPEVIHEAITFKSGADMIDGYLARPKAKEKYPPVLVVAGNKISEEYIRNTTALLAQAGFVGLAPNIFALQLDTMSAEEKRQVFAHQITDERIFRDLQAGMDYLQAQPFVKRGKVGITGFCFGGRCALMFAARSKKIGAVVPFYGNLKTPAAANRAVDPIDLVKQMKIPIQGHYALNDAEIPLAQLRQFEQAVRAQGTAVEMFTYEAAHGFFAYTRASYQEAAARLAWERACQFWREHLR